MSIHHITTLFEFYLKNTNFLIQGKYFEKVHGAAMGSSFSPIVTNLCTEEFETKAIRTAQHPQTLRVRYVDDTFVIQKVEQSQKFLQHIHSNDPHIQYIAETQHRWIHTLFGHLAYIWTWQYTFTTVYRKCTHTHQSLHCDSHHNLSAMYSVFNTQTQG